MRAPLCCLAPPKAAPIVVCDQVNQVDPVHQVNKVDEVHQVHQVDPVHQVNEIDEVHQVKQLFRVFVVCFFGKYINGKCQQKKRHDATIISCADFCPQLSRRLLS